MKKSFFQKKTIRKLRKKNRKSRKSKKHLGGFISPSHISNMYNTANQTYQSLNDTYQSTKQKYLDMQEKYNEMKQQYNDMQEKMNEIYNDPQVQQHLQNLNTLSANLSPTSQLPALPIPVNNEPAIKGGFISSLNNTYNSNKQKISSVYNNPDVQKNLKDLSTHSYNTAKHGSLMGVNLATGAPFSAAYRGYNTYSSAKKGMTTAKKLYSSANNAYKSSNTANI